jgi:L-asparaginase/Glu-tRNA(Gln) amidotransferase subunit D
MDTVWLGSLGGTIAMAAETVGGGVVPKLGADQLIAAIPDLASIARIHAETLQSVPSASLTFEQMIGVLAWAQEKVRAGARGVVITQGTDTLEETSYLLDLFWSGDAPLVVTGAMRSASGVGADGPANLLAAVRVAIAEESRGRGVLGRHERHHPCGATGDEVRRAVGAGLHIAGHRTARRDARRQSRLFPCAACTQGAANAGQNGSPYRPAGSRLQRQHRLD